MESVQVTITDQQIRDGIEKSISEALKSSYNNPVNDAVNKALKEKEGAIKLLVDEIINSAILNPDFKSKLGDLVLSKMVEFALKK